MSESNVFNDARTFATAGNTSSNVSSVDQSVYNSAKAFAAGGDVSSNDNQNSIYNDAKAFATGGHVTNSAESASTSYMAMGGPVSGPGGPTSDSILTWLSDGEYVVNAAATAENYDLLEAINNGDSTSTVSNSTSNVYSDAKAYASGGHVSTSTIMRSANRYAMGGSVHHGDHMAEGGLVSDAAAPMSLAESAAYRDSTATPQKTELNVSINSEVAADWEVNQIDESTVEIIARRVSKEVVRSDAGKAVAADIASPTSHVSKSLKNNTTAGRRNNG